MKCPYDLEFAKDYNEFESCDECAENDKNKEIYIECGITWQRDYSAENL